MGRFYVDLAEQDKMLDDPDPAARGTEFAERILNYDGGIVKMKGANGKNVFDAFMSLNEPIISPDKWANDEVWPRRSHAYNHFQCAFRERLVREGFEAVAFNFAAGNFSRGEHYL